MVILYLRSGCSRVANLRCASPGEAAWNPSGFRNPIICLERPVLSLRSRRTPADFRNVVRLREGYRWITCEFLILHLPIRDETLILISAPSEMKRRTVNGRKRLCEILYRKALLRLQCGAG